MNRFQRRVVIKEELVMLTGHAHQAAVLNQFLYWAQRCRDRAQFEAEERAGGGERRHGWIYKSADELLQEVMLPVSARTLHRYLAQLVADGWLQRRRNPDHRWDRCWQYRPNLRLIQERLQQMGYRLEHFDDLSVAEPQQALQRPLQQRETRSARRAPLHPDRAVGRRNQAVSRPLRVPAAYAARAHGGDDQQASGRDDGPAAERRSERAVAGATAPDPAGAGRTAEGGGEPNQEILDVCDEVGIFEPKRGELARTAHVIARGPQYVRAHVEKAPSIGCAIWRIEQGWSQPKPKPINGMVDWESLVQR